jgi:predicted glycoside hydrolase/deacetylase ChbG (UPF0249 family)
MSTRIRLVTRGDDAGSCHSANRAILESVNAGVLHNVSLMVPGPAFDEAAEIFRHRDDVCLGLHITLNAEWHKVKWGSVSAPQDVPSLLDDNGYFTPTPNALHERGFSDDEVMLEIRAQLQKARGAGLNIQYVDEHMGVSWMGDLRSRIAQFCREEKLLDAHSVQGLPFLNYDFNDCVGDWMNALQRAQPDTYVLVTHPGYDADDMRVFTRENLQPGEVAHERDAERRAWCDPRLPQLLGEAGVKTVRYSDVLS